MKNFIKKRLNEDLEYHHASNAEPKSDNYELGLEEGMDKYGALEMDLKKVIEKHSLNFAEFDGDSYGIIGAMNQVMDGMFQKV